MKRQNKYFIAVIASCCIVALSGCDNSSVKVGNDQRLVYGTVEKIVGNEIVLQRQYESREEENNTKEDSSSSEQSFSSDSSSAQESREESESSSGSEEESQEESESSLDSEEESQNETDISDDTEVIVALQLPVGIPIHKENKEISFTEIEEGDPLKILMEKDSSGIEVPVEAWVAELTKKEKKSLEAQEPTTAVPAQSTEQTTGIPVQSTEPTTGVPAQSTEQMTTGSTPSSEVETSSSVSEKMTEPNFQN
ncbi:hypothetical protein NDGK_00654 [Clostridiales bacterium CHKCI001]|nr:hypothetical protein NDGK_00654 [Clostridiales bacterium CHKCI001]